MVGGAAVRKHALITIDNIPYIIYVITHSHTHTHTGARTVDKCLQCN